jgi:hypothetical protein
LADIALHALLMEKTLQPGDFMKPALFALALLPLAGLAGCADNFSSVQPVTVQTTADNAPLAGAECMLTNAKGNWLVITPMTVSVHRGSESLGVNCTKSGYAPATEMVQSKVNMGSVLVAGAVYSTVSGSAWNYPQNIVVPMQAASAAPAK